MSVSNLDRKVKYDGDDSSTDFTFNFRVLNEDELLVYLVDESVDPEVQTLQTINTDYTLTLNENEGGSVSFTTAPASSLKVLLFRETAIEQPLDLPTNSRFPAQQIENSLDRLTLQNIELAEEIERSVKLPEGSEGSNLFIPAPEANRLVGWNADGTALENKDDISDLSTLVSSAASASTAAAAALASQTAAAASATAADLDATDAASSAASIIGDVALAQTAASNASTSETNAAASATAAGNSETAAGLSETNAAGSATAAATSETNALQAETNAGLAQTGAETAETNAAASETAAGVSAVAAAGSAAAAVVTANSIGDLDSLSDVDLTTNAPADGETIVFDSASGNFIPGASSGGGGSTGVNIGDGGTYTIEGVPEITTTAVADGDNANSNGFYFPRGTKSETIWNGTQEQIILGIQNLSDAPTDDSGVFHTIRNNSTTYSLEMRNNNGGNGSLRIMNPNGDVRYYIRPKTSATYVLRSDDRWYLHSSSSDQVGLGSENDFTTNNNFTSIRLSGRQALVAVGYNTINSVGPQTLSRSPQLITHWTGGSGDMELRGFFRESTDSTRLSNNDVMFHIIRNGSSTDSIRLVHQQGTAGTVSYFDCPDNKDLIIPPFGQAILMMDLGLRWRVVSHSGYTVETLGSEEIELDNATFDSDIDGWTFSTSNTNVGTVASHQVAGLKEGTAQLAISTDDGDLGGNPGPGDAGDDTVFTTLITVDEFQQEQGFLDVEFDLRPEGTEGSTSKEFKLGLLSSSGATLYDEYVFGGKNDPDTLYDIPAVIDEGKTYKVKVRLTLDSAVTSYQIRLTISQSRLF